MNPRDAGRDGRSAHWVGAFASLGYAYLGLLVGLLATAAYILVLNDHFGFAFLVGGLVVSLLSALRVRLGPPVGRVVTPGEAPELFRLLEEVRRELDAPAVHHVVLTPDANASVVDLPRYALFGSRRFLTIGVPLLRALPVDELRALILTKRAHLAHHGRLRLWAARMHTTWNALATSAAYGGSWFAWLLVPFFRWYVPRLAVVRRAFLVQKRTRNLSASSVVVLAIELSVPWYRPDFGGARQEILASQPTRSSLFDAFRS